MSSSSRSRTWPACSSSVRARSGLTPNAAGFLPSSSVTDYGLSHRMWTCGSRGDTGEEALDAAASTRAYEAKNKSRRQGQHRLRLAIVGRWKRRASFTRFRLLCRTGRIRSIDAQEIAHGERGKHDHRRGVFWPLVDRVLRNAARAPGPSASGAEIPRLSVAGSRKDAVIRNQSRGHSAAERRADYSGSRSHLAQAIVGGFPLRVEVRGRGGRSA